MKKILFILALLPCFAFAQQDAQYGMYMFNHLAINPAYAGSKDVLSATFLVRSQWTGMDGAPKTSTLSLHSPTKKKKMGLGAYIFSESIGPKRTNGVYGTYNYKIKMGNGRLALGVGAGLLSYRINWSEIKFKDQGDVTSFYQTYNTTLLDFTGGAYYQNNSFYAGFSITHLNGATIFSHTPVDTNDYAANMQLRPHGFATIGKGFKVGEDVIINPSAVFKFYGSTTPSIDINVNVNLKRKIWAGLSYRSNYGIVFLTQYNINDKLKIGYCVDKGFNRLGRVAGLSHEIILGYDFNIYHTKIISPRFL